jgi:minimal PKS chain-length factor (CLF/KS beta)
MTAVISRSQQGSAGTTPAARAIVTGIGIVAPNGADLEEYWASTLAGTSGLATITRFDPSQYDGSVAGQVDIDVTAQISSRLLPQTDHMTRLALVVSDAALTDAGVDPSTLDRFAAGVVTAASAGGFEFGQKELEALWSKGAEHVSAYQSFAWFYPVNTGQISIRHDLRGPGGAIVADQAGGLDAISKARRHIRGGTPYMVTGGVDVSLCPWSWICFVRSGRLSAEADPTRAYLPFDASASGFVPGEGGAILILEDEQNARDRGAQRYGEIAGYGTAFDPAPGVAGRPGIVRAIENALADADVATHEIDVVFADASGVPELDRVEADAIAGIFGPRALPVTAPKTMTGRLLGGGGPLDVATALLSIRDGVIPPTVNVSAPAYNDAIDLVVDAPRQARLSSALVIARGLGGFNSALIVRGVD